MNEYRHSPEHLYVRAAAGGEPTIEGYAAVFNQESEPLGGFTERIEPGAFQDTLKEQADVRALVNHDPSQLLGRSGAGTLSLSEDDHGLRVSIKPPDTTVGRDTMESLRRGDLSQMSFAFTLRGSDGEKWNDDFTERRLLAVNLRDVSVVAYPAYTDTEAVARSIADVACRAATERSRARLAALKANA